jgi:hypothetical protein
MGTDYGKAEQRKNRTQIPLYPPLSKGEFSLQDSNPSLEKHALSLVEGRGKGRLLGSACSPFPSIMNSD